MVSYKGGLWTVKDIEGPLDMTRFEHVCLQITNVEFGGKELG